MVGTQPLSISKHLHKQLISKNIVSKYNNLLQRKYRPIPSNCLLQKARSLKNEFLSSNQTFKEIVGVETAKLEATSYNAENPRTAPSRNPLKSLEESIEIMNKIVSDHKSSKYLIDKFKTDYFLAQQRSAKENLGIVMKGTPLRSMFRLKKMAKKFRYKLHVRKVNAKAMRLNIKAVVKENIKKYGYLFLAVYLTLNAATITTMYMLVSSDMISIEGAQKIAEWIGMSAAIPKDQKNKEKMAGNSFQAKLLMALVLAKFTTPFRTVAAGVIVHYICKAFGIKPAAIHRCAAKITKRVVQEGNYVAKILPKRINKTIGFGVNMSI
eukprot:Platyproteum_vivax@DN854_c0_g1_i1.p1